MSKTIEIDGKKVSEETVSLALQEYFKKHPPEFEPINIHDGCFIVDVDENSVRIKMGSDYNGICCFQSAEDVDEFIAAHQEAKAYVEKYRK